MENLIELRKALSSLLKDKEIGQPLKTEARKEGPKLAPVAPPVPKPARDERVPAGPVREEPRVEQKIPPNQNAKPKEIPEDVLRKILKVE